MSLEPAVAALVGLVLLSQGLAARQWLAIGCVTVACAGAARGAREPGRGRINRVVRPGQSSIGADAGLHPGRTSRRSTLLRWLRARTIPDPRPCRRRTSVVGCPPRARGLAV